MSKHLEKIKRNNPKVNSLGEVDEFRDATVTIKKLQPKADDLIVIEIEEAITPKLAERMQKYLLDNVTVEGIKVIVICDGAKIRFEQESDKQALPPDIVREQIIERLHDVLLEMGRKYRKQLTDVDAKAIGKVLIEYMTVSRVVRKP